jgi:hypothetical protein
MKVEITKEQTVCDRPGCGKRITAKGGFMFIDESKVEFTGDETLLNVDQRSDAVDLCRECLQQMHNAWNRKADGE